MATERERVQILQTSKENSLVFVQNKITESHEIISSEKHKIQKYEKLLSNLQSVGISEALDSIDDKSTFEEITEDNIEEKIDSIGFK